MRIGIIGTIWLKTPPDRYGGTEQVIANLCNGLSAKGHDVTLFAPANSTVRSRVIPTIDVSLSEKSIPWTNLCYTLYHIATAFSYQKNFDILHMHLNKSQDYTSLALAAYATIPVLFTPHFKIPTSTYKPDRYRVLNTYRYFPFTSISNAQREPDYLHFIETTYNSIRIEDYPFVEKPDDYFVWLGKIVPSKGTKEAILAAQKAGVRLYILGAVERGTQQGLTYFTEEIEPLIDNAHIFFFENVGLPEKAALLGHAKALINPIRWDEPFGLVMIEAQATGTPVISFKRGAAEELVEDNTTGFLVNTMEELVAAIGKVDQIERKACRERVLSHFSTEQMVSSYESAYKKALDYFPSVIEYNNKQTMFLLPPYKRDQNI